MSPSLLSRRLKTLEAHDLIERQIDGEGNQLYLPTQAGCEVQPIIELFGIWGQRWVRESIGRDQRDVSLLMWYLRCGVDVAHFSQKRSVVNFIYDDRPRLKKGNWWADKWWLVVGDGEVDLCSKDPGFEVDLFVTTNLKTMIDVALGDVSVHAALNDGKIELHGDQILARRFEAWLPRSGFADVARPPHPVQPLLRASS